MLFAGNKRRFTKNLCVYKKHFEADQHNTIYVWMQSFLTFTNKYVIYVVCVFHTSTRLRRTELLYCIIRYKNVMHPARWLKFQYYLPADKLKINAAWFYEEYVSPGIVVVRLNRYVKISSWVNKCGTIIVSNENKPKRMRVFSLLHRNFIYLSLVSSCDFLLYKLYKSKLNDFS